MAGIGLSFDPTHVRSNGLATWAVKHGSDAARYPLGRLSNSDIDFKAVEQLDSLSRNRAKAYNIKVSARALNTQNTCVTTKEYTGMLALLNVFGRAVYDQSFTDVDAQAFGGPFGLSAKFHVDNNDRYVEFTAMYRGPLDNLSVATLYGVDEVMGTPSANGTPNALDVLYQLNALPDVIPPAGIYKHEVSFDGGSTYEAIGPIINGTLDIEQTLTKEDTQGRVYPVNLKVVVALDSAASSAERALLDSASGVSWHRITLMDQTQLVFSSGVGITWNWKAKGDADSGEQLITFGGQGVIPLASWTSGATASPLLCSAV